MAGGHEMNAVKIEVVIPENRELRVTLPPEVEPGPAEVIVLSEEPSGTEPTDIEGLAKEVDAWRAQHAQSRRSKEEIDQYLAEERASWGDDE
jgi:hypothetical protein